MYWLILLASWVCFETWTVTLRKRTVFLSVVGLATYKLLLFGFTAETRWEILHRSSWSRSWQHVTTWLLLQKLYSCHGHNSCKLILQQLLLEIFEKFQTLQLLQTLQWMEEVSFFQSHSVFPFGLLFAYSLALLSYCHWALSSFHQDSIG